MGGGPSVAVSDDASVDSVFRVAVLNERRGMLKPTRETDERSDKRTRPFRFVVERDFVKVGYGR